MPDLVLNNDDSLPSNRRMKIDRFGLVAYPDSKGKSIGEGIVKRKPKKESDGVHVN